MSNWQDRGQGCTYSYAARKRRCKADWAGTGIGDAFKAELDYYQRLPAQRAFYGLVAKAQQRVAENLGAPPEEAARPQAKPQISPCYTNYPPNLAAHAAIGLTAYLEFTARCPHPLLLTEMAGYLKHAAETDRTRVDPEVYGRTAFLVAQAVQQRLVLEELSRICRLSSVEIYRVFCSSQQGLHFRSVKEVIEAVILFGELLPPWKTLELHPTTKAMLLDLERMSRGFLDRLPGTPPQGLLSLGSDWVRKACRALAPYLPLPAKRPKPPQSQERDKPKFLREPISDEAPRRLEHPSPPGQAPDYIEPLEAPTPPTLWKAGDAAGHLSQRLRMPGDDSSNRMDQCLELDEPSFETLSEFSYLMNKAGGQARDWEDMRYELVEAILEQSSFEEGPITGCPADGHEVEMTLPGGKQAGGEIFDRPLELSGDQQAIDRLRSDARVVTDQLRRNLYPNLTHLPESLRLRTGGTLDGGRLALAAFCPTVFKRVRHVEKADRRGRPVLVIACDGSGSLEHNQMRMLKILATAWLESIVGSEIQLLAGIYHSGSVRPGVAGPLVQWIYHPQKTPSLGLADAIRAVASLPDKGTGVQSDALSLAYIMAEARSLARGGMVYFTMLTDTAWNRSFQEEMNGQQEVAALLRTLREEMGPKLHALLVALGEQCTLGLREYLDKVIPVSGQDLNDPAALAKRVGEYVSSRLRQPRRPVQSH